MDDELRSYLDSHPTHHETIENWPIQGDLRVRLGLAEILPPKSVLSSILAIVLGPDQRVLCLWPSNLTGSIAHFLIGGRSQSGETPEETAIREVAEETGWCIKPIRMIGFRHFFHLGPRSAKSARPYPDFIQSIYTAWAVAYDPSLIIPDDLIPAEFINIADAERITEIAQRPLLYEAVKELGWAEKLSKPVHRI